MINLHQILHHHEQKQRLVDDSLDVDVLFLCGLLGLLCHRSQDEPRVHLCVLHLKGSIRI